MQTLVERITVDDAKVAGVINRCSLKALQATRRQKRRREHRCRRAIWEERKSLIALREIRERKRVVFMMKLSHGRWR